MPVFDTQEPIAVVVTARNSDVRVVASDRSDATVEVRSTGGGDPDADLAAVEFVDGRLAITQATRKGPSLWGIELRDILGAGNSAGIEVRIEVPTGSRLQIDSEYGEIRADGTLGACRIRSGYSEVRLDRTGPVEVRCRHGEVAVRHVTGHAEIALGSGEVRLGFVDGTAEITDDHGDVEIGEITGAAQLTGSHGDLAVGRAHAGVQARSAYGSVRVGAAVSGVVDLTNTYGDLEVGIATGTAAWLDLSSATGRVRNRLDPKQGPDGFDRTVEVHARTRDGDVTVQRA